MRRFYVTDALEKAEERNAALERAKKHTKKDSENNIKVPLPFLISI